MREGWTYKPIGEIADVTDFVANGSFASLRENVKYLNEPNYAILVRLADYSSNFDSSKFVYVDQKSYTFLAKSSLQGGEIIMSNVGSLGKLFICPNLNQPMTLGPNTIVIKTAYNKFFYYLFSSDCFQSELKTISSQTALPKFNKTSFKKLQVPLPPKSQQEAIVSELDEINSLLALKREQLQTYDKLAQSLFYEMFGDPVENEKGWEVKKLKEVCSCITKGTTPTSIGFSFEDRGVSFVKVETFSEDGFILQRKVSFISEECNNVLKRSQLEENDILFSIAGAIGRVAVVPSYILPANTNQALAIIRLNQKDKTTIQYYKYLLSSSCIKRQTNMLKTGVAQQNISLGQLGSFLIPLPPLSLQRQFASRIEQIEEQKKQVQAAIERLETLLASRMQYWFE